MTSTSVLGSINSQAVNLLNLTQPTSKASGPDFKDFLNQTGSDNLKSDVKAPQDFKKQKLVNNDSKPIENKTAEVKEVIKSEGTGKDVSIVKDERPVTDAEVDTVKEAVSSVFEALKEEFEVTDEEILQALENLGLTPIAVLDVQLLPEITAELEGAEDILSIMTDEPLYESLMTVEDKAAAAVETLLNDAEIDPEAFKEAIKDIERKPEAEKPVMPIKADAESSKEAQTVALEDKISIKIDRALTRTEVKKNSEVNLNNNVTEETEFKPITSDFKRSDFFDRSKDQGPKDNPMNFVNNLLNKAVEAMNEASETVSYTTFDARNILNQITDAIKVDISPETSEINLRLHPESLGTVSVKVSANHEGVLTARFTAQNESVKAIIESQAIVLKETLEAKGVTVEAVEVTVQSHEFERNLSDSQSRRGNNNSSEGSKKKSIGGIELDEDVTTDTPEEKLARAMMAAGGNA
ncbi:MAG: flagellar hook-length control protein FliK [Lachnospiraceae bacterium]|nr:flagellar hook-length control protein FliK [Lachnospiraceae bacterium]